tara:strand:+ start:3982 stop:4191 length:210 start_codon:yes stop_codon:yes gene_type:complete
MGFGPSGTFLFYSIAPSCGSPMGVSARIRVMVLLILSRCKPSCDMGERFLASGAGGKVVYDAREWSVWA